MANFDIEGFPTHHRILHVKQEVKASELSVLAVVLAADVERTALLQQEKELVAKMKTAADAQLQTALSQELAEVYDRMSIINCDSAEARASIILSGLRFTQEMQSESTNKLSGGWKMRVALAGALFIEPDLLMLDEPTNHLDLEAVLWLQAYLQTYKHSVLVVSHDRAFLNEICSDIILFKNQKLTYYRGNYDAFESARKESLLVQQRQFAAQQEKVLYLFLILAYAWLIVCL
jgi:ATP-binding cassette subfamily F protein 3